MRNILSLTELNVRILAKETYSSSKKKKKERETRRVEFIFVL